MNTLETGYCAAICMCGRFFFTCQKQLESNEIGCKPCDEHFALEKSLGVE